MPRSAFGLAVLVLWALVGCAGAKPYEVLRKQEPLIPVERGALAVGLLQVHAEDAVLELAPEMYLNVNGLVVKAMKEQLGALGIEAVDYTDFGYEVAWRKTPKPGGVDFSLEALPPLPLGVRTPLVTVVEVLEWRLFEPNAAGWSRHLARITLVLSTWTREGAPLRSEVVQVTAGAGDTVRLLSGSSYREAEASARQRSPGALPTDPDALFLAALGHALGVHFIDYQALQVQEWHVPSEDGASRSGLTYLRAGLDDKALAVFTQAFEANPRAHGALYNAALVHIARGEDAEALELLARARAVKDKALYRRVMKDVQQRMERWQQRRQSLGHVDPSNPGVTVKVAAGLLDVPVPGEALTRNIAGDKAGRVVEPQRTCFLATGEANNDTRWLRAGTATDIDGKLLAEYHPEHCKPPQGSCYIDYYQLEDNPSAENEANRWSIRYSPGMNDIKVNARREGEFKMADIGDRMTKFLLWLVSEKQPVVRQWADFATTRHRYRYCQQKP
jgi:tetratricopeptide (TPR) repeat protein